MIRIIRHKTGFSDDTAYVEVNGEEVTIVNTRGVRSLQPRGCDLLEIEDVEEFIKDGLWIEEASEGEEV